MRKQLAWLGYVGVLTAVWALVLVAATLMHAEGSLGGHRGLDPPGAHAGGGHSAGLRGSGAEVPAVRHRPHHFPHPGLHLVTGLLVGVYAGLVLLATRVLSFHSTVAVAASTLAAAALFSPLRRVQRRIDRWFNRAQYDADQTVSAFAARLKGTVDLDSVREDLAGVVYQAWNPPMSWSG